MRALAQGIDERTSWDRYLRLEGEHTDLRVVRRTIAWIRDEFAAAARREQRPGTARLILLDPEQFSPTTPLPTLSDFAQAQGLEDFSEAEQIEAYEAAFPGGAQQGGPAGRASRRTRVVERQLEALRWLEGHTAQDPRPADSVSAWLNPAMAARLELGGLHTLDALVARINETGARWWLKVPGVGERKAARILDWLRANEEPLGLRVGTHASHRRRQVNPRDLAAVVPAGTALVPYEKFVVPAELDGRAGRNRAPQHKCLLAADTDHAAVGAWLAAKCLQDAPGELSPTQRSYRKEAERLLLWAVLERKTALSSLDLEDALAYREFLAHPPPAWCGPRHNQRWSPLWRPLEGPLAPTAVRQAMAILRGLFAFLMRQNYVASNPFAAMTEPVEAPRALGMHRTLSIAQWSHLDQLLARHAATEAGRRLRRGMRWVYATGLRLAEITSATCGDLQQVVYRTPDGRDAGGWLLRVHGKAGRQREVPVPADLVADLEEELAHHGFERQVGASGNSSIHVLARFDLKPEHPKPWSASGFYSAIKLFMAQAARTLDAAQAEHLQRASIHWLRHAHGAHALQGSEGRSPVPIQVVQNNLGHVSVGTTAGYLGAQSRAGLMEMQRFWTPAPEFAPDPSSVQSADQLTVQPIVQPADRAL
ncbi:phage integrase family protein [Variovorax sp. H27-G14]|uniref:phage integrase family protein n=1 Tax=Variovorax sp. H27-G14 TaxID=3111914 RepID=UPI0038FC6E57